MMTGSRIQLKVRSTRVSEAFETLVLPILEDDLEEVIKRIKGQPRPRWHAWHR